MSRLTDRLMTRYYSGARYDGTKQFYDRIRGLARPEHRVLNLGAGPTTLDATRTLKGEVLEIVGADIDPVVLDNTEVNRGVLIREGKIDIPDAYFDLAFSDFVLEHVEHPSQFLNELYRVLKPGGSFLFRTPNKYHYVALVSRWTSHDFHLKVANRARELHQDAHEPWPTFYRMNSRRSLRGLARAAGFETAELHMIELEPSYLQFHVAPFLAGMAYERTVNSTELLAGLRVNILGRLVKPAR
jgi:SAM-dependent methyltransferase